jgi:hypothetical protein
VPRLLARLVIVYFAHVVRLGASSPHAARCRLLRPCRATGCLGSSRDSSLTASPMLCIRAHRLSVALALAMRLVTPSRSSTTQRPAAPALLRLCRASGRFVSLLDFSSVSRTSSCHVHGHSVSWLNYSSQACTGSTAPMSCIQTSRPIARLLVGRSHWLSPCARSLRLDYSSPGCTGFTTPMSCIQTCRLIA